MGKSVELILCITYFGTLEIPVNLSKWNNMHNYTNEQCWFFNNMSNLKRMTQIMTSSIDEVRPKIQMFYLPEKSTLFACIL